MSAKVAHQPVKLADAANAGIAGYRLSSRAPVSKSSRWTRTRIISRP
jgi:hypothetical protein